MGIQNKRNMKSNIIKERVYREIAKETSKGPYDLFTLRTKFVKHKVVESGNKFDTAIEGLKSDGRVIVRGKEIMINPEAVKHGTFFTKSNKNFGYVVFDGDNHEYGIDLRDAKGFRSNERVVVGFNFYGNRPDIPFIISKENEFTLQENEASSSKARRKAPSIFETENGQSNIVYGRVMKLNHDELVFIPNDKSRFKKNISILNEKSTMAQYQDKICTMEIITDEDGFSPAMGFIKEIKGEAGNPIAEYDAIAESHGANMDWGGEFLEKEIKKIPTEVDLSDFTLTDEKGTVLSGNGSERIVDLRNLQFTTTDPATCKDMDDAIYSTFDKNGNLVVYTAVANVSKYVDLNSEIGKRYIRGAFTTYAPNKAYNILPPELSTNICSLNPNVDRLAFVIKTVVDPKTGIPKESKIMDTVIQSHEKYSYEKAQEICDNNPQITLEKLREKIASGEELSKEEQVVMNEKASDILWKGFKKRELIEFNTNDEYDVEFNEDMSNIIDIKQQEHIKYHKVIEAFMLTANEATAQFAKENGIPNIYRVHEAPNESKFEQAEEFFGYMNIPFDGELSPNSIRKIIASVKDTNQEKIVNNFLVRMQSKAKYNISTNPEEVGFISNKSRRINKQKQKNSNENNSEVATVVNMKDIVDSLDQEISHFGLQSEHYSHTTSPIRRITDYITHYNILAFMKGKEMLSEDYVRDICQWANQMQDENDAAEREFKEVDSAIYCEGHIDDVMKGYVCGFKKLNDSKYATIDDIVVLVENEEKGIKVQIPAGELLENKGINTKNIVISPFGSALINRESRVPLIKLCSPISFRIAQADRITRQVFASSNLQQEHSSYNFPNFGDNAERLQKVPSQGSLKRERMNANRLYKIAQHEVTEKMEDMIDAKGRKLKRETINRGGPDFISAKEAYEANKTQNIARRKKIEKTKMRELDDFESYLLEETEIEDDKQDE